MALYEPCDFDVLLGPGPATIGADCYVCGWMCECECDIEYMPWSSFFIISNESYIGNSQHSRNFNALGTST